MNVFSRFRRAILWSLLALAAMSASIVTAQDGPALTARYSFDDGSGRVDFDLEQLADEMTELAISTEALFGLDTSGYDTLENFGLNETVIQNMINQGGQLTPLGQGLAQGGMPAAASIVIQVFILECQKLGPDFVPFKGAPKLGRSSMQAVQFARLKDTTDGLGRGQFDIRTTKFGLCRNKTTNDVEGVTINVRWVFNVNGDSLETSIAPQNGPPLKGPGGKLYGQNFHAEGTGIQMVLLQINGADVPQNNPIYSIVSDACIDIWFVDPVDGPDINVPASITNYGIFCAGGFCKADPPGLDATQ